MAKPLRCGRCGLENDPSFYYCFECGQGLREAPPAAAAAARRFCSGCGARITAGFRFCGRCGRPVDVGAPASAAASPPAPSPPAAPSPAAPSPAAPPAPQWLEPVAAPPAPPAAPGPRLPASPAIPGGEAPRGPRLSIVRHDGQPAASFALSREVTVLGRAPGEGQIADDPTVSPRHARFTVRDRHVTVEDLGSVAGVFLRLRTPKALVLGDEIRLGRQLLRLEPLARAAEQPGPTPWGCPDPGYTMRLSQLLEGGGLGEIFPLKTGENILGREAGEVAFPSDRYVSSRHARIDVSEGMATLTDLGSSNGTFLKISGAVELQRGDQLLVGTQLVRLDG